jgi:hypothetical protein
MKGWLQFFDIPYFDFGRPKTKYIQQQQAEG